VAIEIVFETHSVTVDNEQGRATGWLPGELSGQGRMLAAELGRHRGDDGITAGRPAPLCIESAVPPFDLPTCERADAGHKGSDTQTARSAGRTPQPAPVTADG
jgi:hypothetical protein